MAKYRTCELLFNYADTRTQEFFIEGNNPARTDPVALRPDPA
ncbi:MAG: hypothetical protein R3F11_12110 [Verrucomicrobiales bacterium]